ncbi:MAG TPA: hypothetical protein VNE62_12655 [Actinomycetota bacterium]|nr:hypothetical protein [Actinomycetota bacterium]
MNRKLMAAITALAVAALAAPAEAADTAVTATVSTTGLRALTAPAPFAITPNLNGLTGTSSTATVNVVETATTGATWNVTAALCGATDSDAVLTGFQPAANCTVKRLDRDDLAASIPGTRVSINDADSTVAVPATSGGTNTVGGGALDADKTILSNSGQNATTIYSGTHSYVGPFALDLNGFDRTGTFYGYLRLTLNQ